MGRRNHRHKNQKKKPKNRRDTINRQQSDGKHKKTVKSKADKGSSLSSSTISDILDIETPLWTVVDNGISNSNR